MQALETGNHNLIKSAVHIAYFMRGSVQYDDVLEKTYYERSTMIDFINERMQYESDKCKETKGQLQPIY